MIDVLYEDNHLLVVNKPAGIATMGVERGERSLVVDAKKYLKEKYDKPGNVYLGVVSRLDAVVSGVIVLARTSKAADRLTRQFRDNQVQKTYWALVSPPPSATGKWSDWLRKNEALRQMEVCRPHDAGAQQAQLTVQLLEQNQRYAWLEINLLTGRKHQIRVQCAARECPVVGDRKYGSREKFSEPGIALHSVRLQLEHPTRQERLEFAAPLPRAWHGLLSQLGWSDRWPGDAT